MYFQTRSTKFNNQSFEYGGRKYHSKKEAGYAKELDLLVKAGIVKEVIPQYKIELRVYGKKIGNYYVDFKLIFSDGHIEYHEVKGFETELWRWKWKHTEAQLNYEEPDSKLLVIK